ASFAWLANVQRFCLRSPHLVRKSFGESLSEIIIAKNNVEARLSHILLVNLQKNYLHKPHKTTLWD
ncbi:MAG: hypothetical protein ACI30Q_00355, partial [Muribaculaceae bacterium]